MAETYEIIFDQECVGRAIVERNGLYLCFCCRCRLPNEGLYRIHVIGDDVREDLGICIPMDDGFGMDKRIPVKRLGEGAFCFELLPKDWELTAAEPKLVEEQETAMPVPQFIPVSEDEPFEHLDKLENAHMEIRDDVPGVVIDEIIKLQTEIECSE